MENCIFCEIVRGNVESFKIWEDEDYLVFLDAFPTMRGQVLVIPKKHEDYLFDLEDRDYFNLMSVAKFISVAMKKAFQAKKIGIIVEGLEVSHVHIRLYPLIDSGFDFTKKSFSEEEMKSFVEKIKMALGSADLPASAS